MPEKFAIAVHGGAFQSDKEYTPQVEFLHALLLECREILKAGASSLEAVSRAVTGMEDSGLFNAGKGAVPNRAGYYELDAAIMNGTNGQAGAVAALRNFKNPVLAARLVMEASPHVLLVGEGAAEFLRKNDMKALEDAKAYFDARQIAPQPEAKLGTVGAVALDTSGSLSAATSTGGIKNQLEGRVGDTPIIGASTYADENLAVSTTGQGEYFMRGVSAYDAAALCAYAGKSLGESIDTVLAKIKAKGGSGGMIAVNRDGEVRFGFNTKGMHRGWADETGEIFTASQP